MMKEIKGALAFGQRHARRQIGLSTGFSLGRNIVGW